MLVKATTALPSQDYNDKAIDKTLKYPTKAAAKETKKLTKNRRHKIYFYFLQDFYRQEFILALQ